MTCSQCGAALRETARICIQCGIAVKVDPAVHTNPKQSSALSTGRFAGGLPADRALPVYEV